VIELEAERSRKAERSVGVGMVGYGEAGWGRFSPQVVPPH